MGMMAGVTEDSGDLERDDLIRQTQFPGITAIPDEAPGVPAGAGNEV